MLDYTLQVVKYKTGVHIVTRGFDPRGFVVKYPLIDIKKDDSINLYIP